MNPNSSRRKSLRRLSGSSRPAVLSRRKNRTSVQPRLEAMEDRVLLSLSTGDLDWIGPDGMGASGDWDVATNWEDEITADNRVPTATDIVHIAAPTSVVTVPTGSTGNVAKKIADCTSELDIKGELTISTTLNDSGGSVMMRGGTLIGADVLAGSTVTATSDVGTLDGVTMDGDLDVGTFDTLNSSSFVVVQVKNDMKLNGDAYIGSYSDSVQGELLFIGDNTLSGTGTVTFGGNTGNSIVSTTGVPSGQMLTIGSGITVHGQNGLFDSDVMENDGLISADGVGVAISEQISILSNAFTNVGTVKGTSGGHIFINFGSGANSGTLSIDTAGASLETAGTWVDTGIIHADSGGTVFLGGTVKLDPPTFTTVGGTVYVTGTIDLSDPMFLQTLTLDAASGSWYLLGGGVKGGTIYTNDGTALIVAPGSSGTLDGVDLEGTLDMTSGFFSFQYLYLYNGLTLNGTILAGSNTGDTFGDAAAQIYTYGDQEVGGTGSILWGDSFYNVLFNYSNGNLGDTGSLALGIGLLVHGNRVAIGTGNTLMNAGSISVDDNGGAGGDFEVDMGTGENVGLMDAGGGALLHVTSTTGTWTNNGTLGSHGGSTLNLDGTYVFGPTSFLSVSPYVADGSAANLGGFFNIAITGPFGPSFFTRTGTVNLTGTLNLTNPAYSDTLTLDDDPTNVAQFNTGNWLLKGGEITGGTIETLDGSALVGTAYGGVLDPVILAGTLDLSTPSAPNTFSFAYVVIVGGLTDNGTILLGDNGVGSPNLAYLFTAGDQMIDGTGSIVFGTSPYNYIFNYATGGADTGTLTLGADLLVHGTSGIISASGYPVINNGTINADGAGGTIVVESYGGSNNGLIEGTGGGNLFFYTPSYSPFVNSNTGTIKIVDGGTATTTGFWTDNGELVAGGGSTFNLGYYGTSQVFSFGASATFDTSAGTVNLIDNLDNTGKTLTLDDANTGSWFLLGGKITGGTIATTGSAVLKGTASGGSLDPVILSGTLDLAPASGFAFTDIYGGMTLDGTILLGNDAGTSYGFVEFYGTQTLDGTGSIKFGGNTGFNNAVYNFSTGGADTGTLTVGSGVTIHGKIGVVSNTGNPVLMNGTVNADDGDEIIFGNYGGVDGGNLKASSGGNLYLGGTPWVATGAFNAGALSSIELAGSFSLSGSPTFTGTGTMNLSGTLTNTGTTMTVAANTLDFRLLGGTVLDGTLGLSGGDLDATTAGGTLSNVIVNGNLDLTDASGVSITAVNGMTLNGTASIGNSAGTTYGVLYTYNDMKIDGSATVLFGGSLSNYLYNYGTTGVETLTLASTVLVHGTNGNIGAGGAYGIDNQGTVNSDAAGTLTVNNANYTNDGTTEASGGGSMILSGGATNFAANTLTGGTWKVVGSSTLLLFGGDIKTNKATILLDGAGSNFWRDYAGTDALGNFNNNATAGAFTIQNSRNQTTGAPGPFMNAGAVTIGAGSKLTATSGYTQSSGSTTLAGGGVLDPAPGMVFNGGSLNGVGTLVGNVTNNGAQINPGGTNAAGQLSVTGNFTQGAGGTLAIELFSSTSFDVFAVSGQASLGGAITVSRPGGFFPSTADSFTVMTYGSRVGNFGMYNGTNLGGGTFLTPIFTPANPAVPGNLKFGVSQDATSAVTIVRGGFSFKKSNKHFFQSVTITNPPTGTTLNGPISLVLDGLSATAGLVNKTGVTTALSPLGSPYINFSVSSLAPGASTYITLEFSDGSGPVYPAINYTARIIVGTGAR